MSQNILYQHTLCPDKNWKCQQKVLIQMCDIKLEFTVYFDASSYRKNSNWANIENYQFDKSLTPLAVGKIHLKIIRGPHVEEAAPVISLVGGDWLDHAGGDLPFVKLTFIMSHEKLQQKYSSILPITCPHCELFLMHFRHSFLIVRDFISAPLFTVT